MYICIYVYMYICIYVYMYICIYVYVYYEQLRAPNLKRMTIKDDKGNLQLQMASQDAASKRWQGALAWRTMTYTAGHLKS